VYDTGRHLLERRWRRPLYTHDRPNTASYRCLLGPFANPYIGTYDYPLKAPQWKAFARPVRGSDLLHLVLI
jgi:hypothetical protein